MFGVSVLGLVFVFNRDRLCRGAPGSCSFTTEYSCLRVWRARNPRAPRAVFPGQLRRMTGGCGVAACSSFGEEQACSWVKRFISSLISVSSTPSWRSRYHVARRKETSPEQSMSVHVGQILRVPKIGLVSALRFMIPRTDPEQSSRSLRECSSPESSTSRCFPSRH